MTTHRPCRGLGRACQTHDGVACFSGDLLPNAPLRAHHASTAQALPTLLGIEIRDVFRLKNGPVLPDLEPIMRFVDRFLVIMRDASKLGRLGVSKAFFHLAMERALIAFQAEDVL